MILDVVYAIGLHCDTVTQWCIRMTCKNALNFKYSEYKKSIARHMVKSGSMEVLEYYGNKFHFLYYDLEKSIINKNLEVTQWLMKKYSILNEYLYNTIAVNGWIHMLTPDSINLDFVALGAIEGGHMNILQLHLMDNEPQLCMLAKSIEFCRLEFVQYFMFHYQMVPSAKDFIYIQYNLPQSTDMIRWLLNHINLTLDIIQIIINHTILHGNTHILELMIENGYTLNNLISREITTLNVLEWLHTRGYIIDSNCIGLIGYNKSNYPLFLYAYQNGYRSHKIISNLLMNGDDVWDLVHHCNINELVDMATIHHCIGVLMRLNVEWNCDHLINAIRYSSSDIVEYILQHQFNIDTCLLKYFRSFDMYQHIDTLYKRSVKPINYHCISPCVILYLEQNTEYQLTQSDYNELLVKPSPKTQHLILKYIHLMPKNPYKKILKHSCDVIVDLTIYGHYPTQKHYSQSILNCYNNISRWIARYI